MPNKLVVSWFGDEFSNRIHYYSNCLKINFLGLPIPLWLTPQANAYKVIENGQYRFYVEFSLPIIGSLVCYHGLLRREDS